MLRLTQWMADYYLCPWGQVLEAVVPAGVRGMAGTREVKFLTAVPDALAKFTALKLRSPQQRKALATLAASERPLTAPELAESADCSLAPIKSSGQAGA
jgi:primosomal protein N' (replication factor Y)